MVKLAIVLLTLFAGVQVVGEFNDAGRAQDAAKVQYVQTVCDEARGEMSGLSEETCGQAQDRANAEYLCGGYSPDSTCWVELK